MQLKIGDIVIRSYAHDPIEWGVIIELETVIVDPQADYQNQEDPLEYVYATVLWPDGYTTQEVDYELWTPEEAFEYSEKKINIFKEQKK